MAMRDQMRRGGKSQGFTLMEILIVAAVIAIFAGIAIFNVQEFYNASIRKGTIVETAEIATGLSMARDDLGFYPKLNYLLQPASLITFPDPNDPKKQLIRADFDYMGFFNPYNPKAPALTAGWLTKRWQVMGYAALSQARNRISQGRGGVCRVRLPSGAGNGGQPSFDDSLVEWPADPWGNPYVLYLLKVEKPSGQQTSTWPEWRFVGSRNPTGQFVDSLNSNEADFMVAVVSYGPNGVPGTTWEAVPGNPWGVNDGSPVRIQTTQQSDARLYRDHDWVYQKGNWSPVTGGTAQFTMLPSDEYDYTRPAAQLRTKILRAPRDPDQLSQWVADFPPPGNPYGAAPLEIRGILDNGSDDLIYRF